MSDVREYLRVCQFPLIWCSGCGNGIILQALVRAIDDLELAKDDVCMVSGIGCSSRIPVYTDFNTLHTTHGRPIAFATGVKVAKPRLNVVVITGDGDGTAIGGNHMIHAARRNIDLTVVLVNNFIYGMTGGQASPATPQGKRATTAPYGQPEPAFDVCALAAAAGATFVARSSAHNPRHVVQMIRRGIQNHGFSLVEVLANCPTSYGRLNREWDPVQMNRWLEEHTIMSNKASKATLEELEGMYVMGVLCERSRTELTDGLAELCARSKEPA